MDAQIARMARSAAGESMTAMTFPTVIEARLPLEPVTRDPFADHLPTSADNSGRASAVTADDREPRRA